MTIWGKWISKFSLSVWNACISLRYMFGSNEIGDGMTCQHWWILMMKKKGNKWQCNYLFMCDVLRNVWRLVKSLLMWYNVCVAVNCAMLQKCHLIIICVNISFALFWDMVVTSFMCIEKEWELKVDATFRGTYITPQWIPFQGSCRAHRHMHGQIYPHGSRNERQRVCITRSDIHHYTWHCILLHCTYLS